MTAKWKPKYDESYWSISMCGAVSHDIWLDLDNDREKLRKGNCFRTKKEANEMLKKIKKLLKEG